MKAQNVLGIFVGTGKATAVCLSPKGHSHTAVDRFEVATDPSREDPFGQLAAGIAQACSQRKIRFGDVMVAIDCGLYMQHQVHSQFTHLKQIAATVRYDTEEVIATDVSGTGLSFQVVSTSQTGSNLNVFSARHQVLEPLILALQSQGMDPVVIEPDAISLARFIHAMSASGHRQDGQGLAVILSSQNCYFLRYDGHRHVVPIRAFPLGTGPDRAGLVAAQTFTTMAALDAAADSVTVYDSSGAVDPKSIPLPGQAQLRPAQWFESLAGDGPDPDVICVAVAYGAALAREDRVHTTNFRNDFMPYQGTRMRLKRAARWASMAMTVLAVAVGLHVQMRLIRLNSDCDKLRQRVEATYGAVMQGRSLPKDRDPVAELRREVRRIKAIRSGELSLQESVLARLTLLLRSFNNYGKSGLQVDSIEVTTSNIRLDGSMPNRREAQSFFKVLRSSRLDVAREALDDTAGRCTFSVILVPNQSARSDTEG